MPTTGQEPGAGTYRCTRCGQVVELDEDGDRLPPCPECHGTEFADVTLGRDRARR